MARRKRKDDEPDWVPPEFDEVGYMRQEIQGARAAVATIGWAFIGAIVALLLFAVLPVLAFFAGIAVGFGMYFVFPLIGIKTEAFKRRDWVGHGITYFFSWLAFWILLLNPPFSDHTDPTIQAISVSAYTPGYTGSLTCNSTLEAAAGLPLRGNTSVLILFRATDNVGLASVRMDVVPATLVQGPSPVSGNNHCAGHRQENYPGGTFSGSFQANAFSYSVTIVAVDTSGRAATFGFTVSPRP
jgi:hypothetical protein